MSCLTFRSFPGLAGLPEAPLQRCKQQVAEETLYRFLVCHGAHWCMMVLLDPILHSFLHSHICYGFIVDGVSSVDTGVGHVTFFG